VSSPAETALEATVGVLAVVVDRIEEALPAFGRVIADVEQDWLDATGRAWVDRAVQLRREMDRELDAALAAGRLAASVVDRLAEEAVRRADGHGVDTPETGGDRAGWPETGVARSGSGPARGGGPRLGGTDAQRVDEERGMRVAELDGG
jgi:hypothetical protein